MFCFVETMVTSEKVEAVTAAVVQASHGQVGFKVLGACTDMNTVYTVIQVAISKEVEENS